MVVAGLDPSAHPTVDSLRIGAGSLRAAGYRSVMSYVDLAVITAAEQGWHSPPDVAREVQRLRCACKQGLGPPQQAAPFPVERIPEVPLADVPLVPDGPCFAQRLLTVGSWWLTREIEIGNAAVSDVSVDGPDIFLTLPASKTDQGGLGVARAHRCACGRQPLSPKLLPHELCPASALHAGRVGYRTIRRSEPTFPDDLLRVSREKSRRRHHRRRGGAA